MNSAESLLGFTLRLLNNGDEQNIQLVKVNYIDNSDHNLFLLQCLMGAINEF